MDLDSSLLHHVIQLRRPWLDDVMLLASASARRFHSDHLGSIVEFPAPHCGNVAPWLAVAFMFVVVDDVVKLFVNWRARSKRFPMSS
jgi:hypothetical protein